MTKSKILSCLKLVEKHQIISRVQLKAHQYSAKDINELVFRKLIDQTEDTVTFVSGRYIEKETDMFALTDKGIDYLADICTDLRRKREERIWRAIPITISALSLALSCFALAKSYGWI